MTVYFEDLKVGQAWDFGEHTMTKDEILAFARAFDPQPFHVDEEAAARSIYGGLIASGWHTIAVCFRMVVDGLVGKSSSMGSPGLDEIRWKLPVRPGDTLRMRVETLEVTPSRSKPDRGSARFRYEAYNQRGEVVMSMIGAGIFGRRPVSGAP